MCFHAFSLVRKSTRTTTCGPCQRPTETTGTKRSSFGGLMRMPRFCCSPHLKHDQRLKNVSDWPGRRARAGETAPERWRDRRSQRAQRPGATIERRLAAECYKAVIEVVLKSAASAREKDNMLAVAPTEPHSQYGFKAEVTSASTIMSARRTSR